MVSSHCQTNLRRVPRRRRFSVSEHGPNSPAQAAARGAGVLDVRAEADEWPGTSQVECFYLPRNSILDRRTSAVRRSGMVAGPPTKEGTVSEVESTRQSSAASSVMIASPATVRPAVATGTVRVGARSDRCAPGASAAMDSAVVVDGLVIPQG